MTHVIPSRADGEESGRRRSRPDSSRSAALGMTCCLLLLLLAACRRDMYDRPERRPLGSSAFFPDRSASRPQVPDTIPRATSNRVPAARGRETYMIDCAPCHGRTGEGDGMIVRHGFPRPPSFFAPPVNALAPADIVRVITNGYGDMYSYAERVPEEDRWAVAAYIKQLQSQRSVYR